MAKQHRSFRDAVIADTARFSGWSKLHRSFLSTAIAVHQSKRAGWAGFTPFMADDYHVMFWDIFSDAPLCGFRCLNFDNDEHKIMALLLCAAICNEI